MTNFHQLISYFYLMKFVVFFFLFFIFILLLPDFFLVNKVIQFLTPRHHALHHGDRIVIIDYCDVTSTYVLPSRSE